jgi:hypothetical protein
MALIFEPRGATSEAHKFLPPELQVHLFQMIDSQIEQGLDMDHWQFFELQKINPKQMLIIHSQYSPARKEEHLLEGYTLSQNYIEVWAIDYEDLGAALMIAEPA